MFRPAFPIARLTPAPYNPRAIDEGAIERLAESIATIGMAKPVIATIDGLIVAGHQRTRALTLLGRDTAPAYILRDVAETDIVRFNQLHNGTDTEQGKEAVTLPPSAALGYEDIAFDGIQANLRSAGASSRKELCRLLERYGAWGAAVATQSGRVVNAGAYAAACKVMRLPLRVFRIPDALAAQASAAFGQQYGRFSYDHLPKQTYMQGYVQMNRLRGNPSGRQLNSPGYTRLLTTLRKSDTLLDFGCGHGNYIRMLAVQGYRALGLEFFARQGMSIDTGRVHRMIDAFCRHLQAHGLFDVVVLDYVLNSTDSQQAEDDVLTLVAAFCKPGGRVLLSGRRTERIDQMAAVSRSGTHRREVEFLDDNGYTAVYRNGSWVYQKYHDPAMIDRLVKTHFSEAPYRLHTGSTAWQLETRADRRPDAAAVEAAIGREFNLPWPGGRTVNRAADALAAWRAVRAPAATSRTDNCGTYETAPLA